MTVRRKQRVLSPDAEKDKEEIGAQNEQPIENVTPAKKTISTPLKAHFDPMYLSLGVLLLIGGICHLGADQASDPALWKFIGICFYVAPFFVGPIYFYCSKRRPQQINTTVPQDQE